MMSLEGRETSLGGYYGNPGIELGEQLPGKWRGNDIYKKQLED